MQEADGGTVPTKSAAGPVVKKATPPRPNVGTSATPSATAKDPKQAPAQPQPAGRGAREAAVQAKRIVGSPALSACEPVAVKQGSGAGPTHPGATEPADEPAEPARIRMSLSAPTYQPSRPVVRIAASPPSNEASTPRAGNQKDGAIQVPNDALRAGQAIAQAPKQSESPARGGAAAKFAVQPIQPLLRPSSDYEGTVESSRMFAGESSRIFGGDASSGLRRRFMPELGSSTMPNVDDVPVARESIFETMRPAPAGGTLSARQSDSPNATQRLWPNGAGLTSRPNSKGLLPEQGQTNDTQPAPIAVNRPQAQQFAPGLAPTQISPIRPAPAVAVRPIVQGPTVPPLVPDPVPAVATAPVPATGGAPGQRPAVPLPRPAAPEPLPTFVASQMAVISRRAHEHIDYGFNLAERRAVYSSQAEFTQALLLVAQALDTSEKTQVHSQAVLMGLQALREADDFVPRQGQVDLNVTRVLATHKTPVLKRAANPQMSPLVAMQAYYTYAQTQLIVAGGREPAAAAALYGMARLQGVMALENEVQKMMGGPKSIALYQAALAIDASNHAAANELGVLLARYGQWADAQLAFAESARLGNQPQTWDNLAQTYRRLGNQRAADEAVERYKVALREKQQHGTGRSPVRLVDPETFVRDSSGSETLDARPLNTPSPTSADQLPSAPTQQVTQQAPVPRQESESTLQKLKTKLQAAVSKTAQADGQLQR
jgi:tetratricopeptide (TPR) repeat protein